LLLRTKIVFAGNFSTDSSNASSKNVKFKNYNGLRPRPPLHPEPPVPPKESEQDPDWRDTG
jgi:hypothetical protein